MKQGYSGICEIILFSKSVLQVPSLKYVQVYGYQFYTQTIYLRLYITELSDKCMRHAGFNQYITITAARGVGSGGSEFDPRWLHDNWSVPLWV